MEAWDDIKELPLAPDNAIEDISNEVDILQEDSAVSDSSVLSWAVMLAEWAANSGAAADNDAVAATDGGGVDVGGTLYHDVVGPLRSCA